MGSMQHMASAQTSNVQVPRQHQQCMQVCSTYLFSCLLECGSCNPCIILSSRMPAARDCTSSTPSPSDAMPAASAKQTGTAAAVNGIINVLGQLAAKPMFMAKVIFMLPTKT